MSKITLRDELMLVNFRSISDDQTGMYRNNTLIVRVYLEIDEWFEFGINDFSYGNDRDKAVEKILTKKILDSEVTSIRHAEEVGVLEIHLAIE